jgi:hypothetical protein
MRRAVFNIRKTPDKNAARRRCALLRLESLEERVVLSLFGAPIFLPLRNSAFISGDFLGNGRDQLAMVNLTQSGPNELVLMDVVNGNAEVLSSEPTDLFGLVAAADLNGDSKLDLLGEGANGILETLLGNGDGTFKAPFDSFAPGVTGPSFLNFLGTTGALVTVGDFNGDGKLDLASISQSQGADFLPEIGVSSFLGNGDGTFQAPRTSTIVDTFFLGQPSALNAGDFNRDGKLDLVFTTFEGSVVVLQGQGDGTFSQPSFTTGSGPDPNDVQIGDLNRDGKLDLVVSNNIGNTVGVFLGNGDGTFGPGQFLPLDQADITHPWGSVIGDFNGDGKLDIAVSSNTPMGGTLLAQVTVFPGNGDGTFGPGQAFSTGSASQEIREGDFTGSGRLDLAVFCSQGIAVLPNTSGVIVTPPKPSQVYVVSLYLDLLHRQPDAGGLAFFSGQVDQGISRAQVVLEIERSPEYRIDQVEGLYATVLGREADPPGLQHFVAAMEAGSSFEDVETSMLGSAECYARAGGTSGGFLNLLYQAVLGRLPDSAGQASFSALLARGFSTYTVSFLVVHSTEAPAGSGERLLQGVPRSRRRPGWPGRLHLPPPQQLLR